MPNPSMIAMRDEETDFFYPDAAPRMVIRTETPAGGGDLNREFHYLAGPMRGLPSHNFPAFNAASGRLRDYGYNIVSPSELDEEIERKMHEESAEGLIDQSLYIECLRRDLRVILNHNCVGIICLPGWHESFGARAVEVYNALWLGLPFFEYDDSREGILLWEFDPAEFLDRYELDWI